MSISRQEEMISVLWIIAALIAFGNDYQVWGWIFAIKGAFDTVIAIRFGIQEILIERQK